MCESTEKEHGNHERIHERIQLATWPKALHDKQTNLPRCPKHIMTAAMSVVCLTFFLIVSMVRLIEQLLRFKIGCLNSELISEFLT